MVGFVSSGYDLHLKMHDHSLSFIFQVYRFFKFLVDVVSREGVMSFVTVISLFISRRCLNFKLGAKIEHPSANI